MSLCIETNPHLIFFLFVLTDEMDSTLFIFLIFCKG